MMADDTAHPHEVLQQIARYHDIGVGTEEFAELMDKEDPLTSYRDQFCHPDIKHNSPDGGNDCIYLYGHSMGLAPKKAKEYTLNQFNRWEQLGGMARLHGDIPWYHQDEKWIQEPLSKIIGSEVDEVVAMNSLTVNMHLFMVSFYRPTSDRHKILLEEKAFPSDHYMIESQIKLHGFDPATSMVLLKPRQPPSGPIEGVASSIGPCVVFNWTT